MPELTEWLEARLRATEDLFKEFHDKQLEHHAQNSHHLWESFINRIAEIESVINEMEQRLMAAIDDLTNAVAADVEGRKALALSVAEIGDAVTAVSAFLTDNPAPSPDVIANLAQQLSTAGYDTKVAAATLDDSALNLEALLPGTAAPSDPVPTDPPMPTDPVPPTDPAPPVIDPALPVTDPAPVDPAPPVPLAADPAATPAS